MCIMLGHLCFVVKPHVKPGHLLCLGMREQLVQARDILAYGLENVSYARQVVALTDGRSIADVSWVKVGFFWY